MPPKKQTVDVAVVGAGLAGLSAAVWLSRLGVEVAVLEARDRPGGRVSTTQIAGSWIDEGGQWLGGGQNRAYGLALDLGLETFPTFETGAYVAIIDGKRQRFSGRLPRINPLVAGDLIQGLSRFERLARGISPESPWHHPRAEALDAQTLENWMRRTFLTSRARKLFGLGSSAVFATEPSEISLLYALFYAKAGHGLRMLLSSAGGAQQDRVIGGTMQLASGLARELDSSVIYDSPVDAIIQKPGAVEVRSRGIHLECKRAIVAVPPILAWKIDYEPPLNPAKDRLLRSLLPGNAIKVHAIYPEPFWRSDGLCGQAAGPDLPISFTFDNSPPDGSLGILVGFAEGKHAAELSRLPEDERRKVILNAFRAYFGPAALTPVEYLERDWSKEIWTRGCYAAHASTGILSRIGEELRSPHGAIHFAGSETATVWVGYMEGALESGERAAREVSTSIGLASD
jgi:monoamine oxidase